MSTADDPLHKPNRPTHSQIAARAYEMYLAEGQPQGRAEAHWRMAEAALFVEGITCAQTGLPRGVSQDPTPKRPRKRR